MVFHRTEYWKWSCLYRFHWEKNKWAVIRPFERSKAFWVNFKTYQVFTHSRTCWKNNKNECRFSYGHYFTEKTTIAKPLNSKFSNEDKQEILTWRNTLLSQVKSYIDNNLYPAKVNLTDATKEHFSQPLVSNKF